MSHRYLVLLLAAAFLLTPPPIANSAEPPASFKERWGLALLPEKLPEIASLLPGTAWVQSHPRTILGVGVGYAVRFPDTAEKRDRPQLHFTSIGYPSVNARDAGIVETTHKFPLAVEGSLLEYGGLVRTASVVKEKRLVLGAVIRVDDRKWYQVSSRKIERDGARKESREIKEFLFEFDDDPLKLDEGKLSVQRHVRKLADQKGETIRLPATFKRQKRANSQAKTREIKLLAEVVERVGHNLPDLFFFDGQEYALLESSDQQFGTGIFEAEKVSP